MVGYNKDKFISSIWITFSGNCKKALSFYQTCFGGQLQFQLFEKELKGFTELPVVCGSLVSERIIIHGSDLVHNEGRKPGNHISIFLQCKNTDDRKFLMEKMGFGRMDDFKGRHPDDQALIEFIDVFDVGWVLGV